MKFSIRIDAEGHGRIKNMIIVSESFEDERILQNFEKAVKEMSLITIEHPGFDNQFQFRFGKIKETN